MIRPNSIESWLARGLTRAKMQNIQGAVSDLSYAAQLAQESGDNESSEIIRRLAIKIDSRLIKKSESKPLVDAVSGLENALRTLAPWILN